MINNHPETIEKLKRDMRLAALFSGPVEGCRQADQNPPHGAVKSVTEQFQEILDVAGADLLETRVE